MLSSETILKLFLPLIFFNPCFSQTSEHDFYVCAAVNRNYVIGSKIVTTSGIHLKNEAGAWQHIGINDPSIFAVSFDPRNRDVFYTAALNGALRTLDGGKSWRIMTSWDITEPKDICVDPHAPDTVYLAHPGGVAVSKDQGMTWLRLEKGLPKRGKYTQTIETDRVREGRVLAGCETGIFLTTNGARSWRRVLKTEETVNDIQQSPHNPDIWVAVTQSAGAWVSRDNGRTWKTFPDVPSEAALYNFAFDSTDSKRMAIGSYTFGVLTSEDGGESWTTRNEGLPDLHHVWRVGVHPDTGQLLVSVYQSALYVSADFGRTWSQEGLEGSAINSFVFLPKEESDAAE
ncbi:MAG: hypothetical protein O7C75_16130 [Verrucomicrobia bacterium]|nr:hypothetical protein [Verrucomicrobiota bacterium]